MKSKLKFRSALNYLPNVKYYETNNEKSMTVPGESMTIKELMQKHVNGSLNADVFRQGHYVDENDDYDFERISRMDMVELDEIRGEIDNLYQRIDQANKKALEESKKAEGKANLVSKSDDVAKRSKEDSEPGELQ